MQTEVIRNGHSLLKISNRQQLEIIRLLKGDPQVGEAAASDVKTFL